MRYVGSRHRDDGLFPPPSWRPPPTSLPPNLLLTWCSNNSRITNQDGTRRGRPYHERNLNGTIVRRMPGARRFWRKHRESSISRSSVHFSKHVTGGSRAMAATGLWRNLTSAPPTSKVAPRKFLSPRRYASAILRAGQECAVSRVEGISDLLPMSPIRPLPATR